MYITFYHILNPLVSTVLCVINGCEDTCKEVC